jgi:mannose/fructose/N-acetylgalactosamine-specific phosphotransferase system component IIB
MRMEIALARIDDRLIHGQVVTSWLKAIGRCDEILICDDSASTDKLIQQVLAMTKPPNMTLRVLSVEDTIRDFGEKLNDPRRVLLITRGPGAMLDLIEGGVEMDYINLGGLGSGPGRKMYKKHVSLSPDELESCRKIENKGVKIEIKMVPSDQGVTL